jgi:uncharacterized protein
VAIFLPVTVVVASASVEPVLTALAVCNVSIYPKRLKPLKRVRPKPKLHLNFKLMFSDTFLTAKWQNLIMANYEIDPKILEKYIPEGTELDLWQGRCYVSLVGFMFLNTKVLGIGFPFHRDFEEVNLRFYVKYPHPTEGVRRGVVFIKEIVPKRMITAIANTFYNENYQTMKMAHEETETDNTLKIKYLWHYQNHWNSLRIEAEKEKSLALPNSEELFITEHYWGYAGEKGVKTTEYNVQHPSWNIHKITDFTIDCAFEKLYGLEFSVLKNLKPTSVFLAEGSDISVLKGKKI